MPSPTLVPELYVSDIGRSLRFYTGVLGFAVLYDRPEERFAYLVRDGAALMLDQPADPGRTWLAGPLHARKQVSREQMCRPRRRCSLFI